MSEKLSPWQKHLLSSRDSTYEAYYQGEWSYPSKSPRLRRLTSKATSENIFKLCVDLYSQYLITTPPELQGLDSSISSFIIQGNYPIVVMPSGEMVFPQKHSIMRCGSSWKAAVFTQDNPDKFYITFIDEATQTATVYSTKSASLTSDLALVSQSQGVQLVVAQAEALALGPLLAPLQDRINQSICDLTIVAEMYARPFWYLLNSSIRVPSRQESDDSDSARIFTTTSEGPFGQLDPPTLRDMVDYHKSLLSSVSMLTGIPSIYLAPGDGEAPSGVALSVMTQRMHDRITILRSVLSDALRRAQLLSGGSPLPDRLFAVEDTSHVSSVDIHAAALAQIGVPVEVITKSLYPELDMSEVDPDRL